MSWLRRAKVEEAPPPPRNDDDFSKTTETLQNDAVAENDVVQLQQQEEEESSPKTTEQQEPFMGVKVRRAASVHGDYRGDYLHVSSKPYLLKILAKQGLFLRHLNLSTLVVSN